MSWRGEKGGIEAARMGHDVIMTPGGTCYFDKYQQDPATEPEAIGGFLPLQKVYEYEPMPKELEADKQKHLLGAQANLWTEYVPTMEHAEYMIFPRIIALSEAVWTERKNMEWPDFQQRLSQHYQLLQRLNVNYCRPSDRVEIRPLIDASSGTTSITLSSEQYKPEIRYTIDGSMPNNNSTLYTGPFSITGSALVKTGIFRKGRMSQRPDTIDINLHKAIGKTITYNKKYSSSYVAQKEATLINGYRGSLTYQDGQWQGFLNDVDVTIDLGKEENLSKLRSTFMQVTGPGVYMPHFVEVSLSKDGTQFTTLEKVLNDVPATDPKLIFKTFEVSLKGQSARYVRFVAKLQRGFLFADEIIID
jgi:hexosaminidase